VHAGEQRKAGRQNRGKAGPNDSISDWPSYFSRDQTDLGRMPRSTLGADRAAPPGATIETPLQDVATGLFEQDPALLAVESR
jgi:hypothetical protein